MKNPIEKERKAKIKQTTDKSLEPSSIRKVTKNKKRIELEWHLNSNKFRVSAHTHTHTLSFTFKTLFYCIELKYAADSFIHINFCLIILCFILPVFLDAFVDFQSGHKMSGITCSW